MDFKTISLGELEATDLDALPFGAIQMDKSGIVTHYNTTETGISGLTKEQVEGRQFFSDVGVCMHNFMVGHKYDQPGSLDELVDYVLTVRMDPTPVILRLLKEDDAEHRYLLVQPK